MSKLHQRIDEAILASPYLQQRQLKVQAKEGRVVLRGNLPSYFQKQIAQETIKRVEGVESIENEITVDWNENPSGWNMNA